MPPEWSKTEAFDHFDTEMENTRWSWSGISRDAGQVVLVLWKDAIKRDADGNWTYRDDDDLGGEWRRRPGHTARVRHLKHSVDSLNGRFRAIIARAEDPAASPRKIAACYPQDGAVWQIDHFNEQTGAFTAHAERA